MHFTCSDFIVIVQRPRIPVEFVLNIP